MIKRDREKERHHSSFLCVVQYLFVDGKNLLDKLLRFASMGHKANHKTIVMDSFLL